MQSFNRHNLTGEDIAAIILLVVGVAIIATTLFWSMPSQTRTEVVALANLPFYENLILQAVDDTTLVLNSVPLFLEKFNEEFTKVAVIDLPIDLDRVSIALRDTGEQIFALSEYVGQSYKELHNPNKRTYGQVAIEKIGQVMGASIDLEEQMKAQGMRIQKNRNR